MIWQERDSSLHGTEFHCSQPWLDHSVGDMKACYTVHHNRFDDYWEAKWWHGNRGHTPDNNARHKSMEQAMQSCADHLQAMLNGIQEMIAIKKPLEA